MSEKIILNKSIHKIKTIKLNDEFEVIPKEDENENLQKQMEIELHNHFIKGFNEGQKEASSRLKKEYTEKLKEIYSLLESIMIKIDNQLIDQYKRINEFIINISFLISEKIIRREIDKESPIFQMIDESLKKITSANQALIKLNPDDLKLVESNIELINKKLSIDNVRLEADNRIEKGGCLIETEIGNSDGRIKSQLETLRRQIESYFEENNA
jgi:flagellar assembly protein FliH